MTPNQNNNNTKIIISIIVTFLLSFIICYFVFKQPTSSSKPRINRNTSSSTSKPPLTQQTLNQLQKYEKIMKPTQKDKKWQFNLNSIPETGFGFMPFSNSEKIIQSPKGDYYYLPEYDEAGNLIKIQEYDSDDNSKYSHVLPEYDTDRNLYQLQQYDSDNNSKWYHFLPEYDTAGNLIKIQEYNSDDKLQSINEYNLQTGKRTKETSYQKDGKTIDYIQEFNPKTGKETKHTQWTSKRLGY